MSFKKQIDSSADWQASSTYSKDMQCTLGTLDDLRVDDLFPEPRQLNSSEFSEHTGGKPRNKKYKEEDFQLVKIAKEYGYNWDIASNAMSDKSKFKIKEKSGIPKRAKPCQELDEEKEKMVLSLYKTYGGNWRKIATFFDGMSASVLKNRFYSVLRPKMSKTELEREEENAKIIIDSKLNEKLHNQASIGDLSEQDKKNKLQGLYQKMNEIEDFIKQTKGQIHNLVIKGTKS